jgi:DNA-binding transcriptional LysR family regulator
MEERERDPKEGHMSELDWYLQINLKARQLRLLVTIDTYRNLTHVAEVTHVTVPAVSKALGELERGLGISLFSRTAQGLVPTPYGECLIRHARSILTDLHRARDELKAMRSGTEGRIHIGVLPASASVLLPQALAILKRRSPRTNVLVTEGSTTILLPELWQGRLDLVVGRLPAPGATVSFEERELLEEPVRLMTGAHHPLSCRKNLKWADLTVYPWILPPIGSILRDPLERALQAHDVPLSNNYIETLSTHFARAYLQVSDCIAVMAGAFATESPQPLHTLPLNLPRMLRPSGVLWNRDRPLSPSAKLMVSSLEEAARHLQERLGVVGRKAGVAKGKAASLP